MEVKKNTRLVNRIGDLEKENRKLQDMLTEMKKVKEDQTLYKQTTMLRHRISELEEQIVKERDNFTVTYK